MTLVQNYLKRKQPKRSNDQVLRSYDGKNLFFLQDVICLWFNHVPDMEELYGSIKPSIKALITDLCSILKPLNRESDFVIELQQPYLQAIGRASSMGLFIINPPHYYPDWLPHPDEWVQSRQSLDASIIDTEKTYTLKKAESFYKYIFLRDDLIKLANQRNQKPSFLFPEVRLDPMNSFALEDAYNSSGDNNNILKNIGGVEDKCLTVMEKNKARKAKNKEFVINEVIPHLKKEHPSLKFTTEIGKHFKNGYNKSSELEKKFHDICCSGGKNAIYEVYDWLIKADATYFIGGGKGYCAKSINRYP